MLSILLRSTDEYYASPGSRISQKGFLTVAWVLTAVSFLFQLARLVTHGKILGKLGWDDFFTSIAWLSLLVFTVLWQIKIPLLYWQFDVVTGRRPATPEFIQAFGGFMPYIVVWNMLFFCCLWSVKLSFMIFFRQLNSKVRAHKIWWWVVLALVMVGLVSSVADFDYQCSVNDITYILVQCTTASRVQFQNRTLYANAATDIVTDLLILSIPIMILWNVQISKKKKAILLALFSVTVLIMATALIRAVLVKPDPSAHVEASIDWLYLWSMVEMAVAIMIASVASFRQLFVSQGSNHPHGSGSKGRESLNRWISNRHLSDILPFLRHSSEEKSMAASDVRPFDNSNDPSSTTALKPIYTSTSIGERAPTIASTGKLSSPSVESNSQHYQWQL